VCKLRDLKKFLLDELQGLDVIAEKRTLFDDENLTKANIISDLERTNLMEEVRRQKLRALWFRNGDKGCVW
jgi:hypothetical protein